MPLGHQGTTLPREPPLSLCLRLYSPVSGVSKYIVTNLNSKGSNQWEG